MPKQKNIAEVVMIRILKTDTKSIVGLYQRSLKQLKKCIMTN